MTERELHKDFESQTQQEAWIERLSANPYAIQTMFVSSLKTVGFPITFEVSEQFDPNNTDNSFLRAHLAHEAANGPKANAIFTQFVMTDKGRMLQAVSELDLEKAQTIPDLTPQPEDEGIDVNRGFVTTFTRTQAIDPDRFVDAELTQYYKDLQDEGVKPYSLEELRMFSYETVSSILTRRPDLQAVK